MLGEVRNDAQNLAGHRVETLTIQANAAALVARSAVAAREVEHAPVRIAAPRDWIEGQIADRVNPAEQPNAEQLPRGAFKRRVGNIRVRPLDQDAFVITAAAGQIPNRRRWRVAGDAQAGKPALSGINEPSAATTSRWIV